MSACIKRTTTSSASIHEPDHLPPIIIHNHKEKHLIEAKEKRSKRRDGLPVGFREIHNTGSLKATTIRVVVGDDGIGIAYSNLNTGRQGLLVQYTRSGIQLSRGMFVSRSISVVSGK